LILIFFGQKGQIDIIDIKGGELALACSQPAEASSNQRWWTRRKS